jgi:hypothetical protein
MGGGWGQCKALMSILNYILLYSPYTIQAIAHAITLLLMTQMKKIIQETKSL